MGIRDHRRLGIDPTRWAICPGAPRSRKGCGHPYNDTIKYAFQSLTWQDVGFDKKDKIFKLEKVWRQDDQEWVNVLGKLKLGEVDADAIQYLHNLKRPLVIKDGVKPTKLYTHRMNVEAENQREFEKLPGQTYNFHAIDVGRIRITRRDGSIESETSLSQEEYRKERKQPHSTARR